MELVDAALILVIIHGMDFSIISDAEKSNRKSNTYG